MSEFIVTAANISIFSGKSKYLADFQIKEFLTTADGKKLADEYANSNS